MLLQLDLQQGKFFFSFFVSSVGFVISSSFNFFLSKDQGQMTQWRKKCVFVDKFHLNQNIFVALRRYTTAQFHLVLGHDAFWKPYGAYRFEYFNP